ncbi:MBL fold metallo-hydrolase [Fusibacter ferrireducens]|uniref:MBL fold metallo-hydrolase n=1 Tax=Fusibacter ferrireducens TaxID=2785058 RepID=A0ABR9ZWY7_9FIRM|nr:MBL fold metallo-hydrolase [Fusibacter ferrireducens]MBF4694985.1 MBL fold metallo-hydrolase [Fusibacter ferrireducens]
MYELEKLGERSYYIESPVKTGIYQIDEQNVLLIDSGNDKDAAKKIAKIIRTQNWHLKWIINTHSHADHIGGNAYLLEQFKCQAFTVGVETAFMKYPILEPSFLYGGYPMKALRNKFLMAKPSEVASIDDFETVTGLSDFEFIHLDGHTFNMIGIKTPDGVWYLGDAINGAHIIEKYHVSFLYDVSAYLESMEKLIKLEGNCFVLAHAGICEDLGELIDINKRKVLEIIALIESFCENEIGFENLLKKIFDHYNLKMDMNQYVLVGSTIKSYLSYLSDGDRIFATFKENNLLWQKNIK